MTNTPLILERLWDAGTPCPFDEVIDVRSPGEFAEDRMPGAVNLPVLNDAERAEVGTLYVQTGAFPARRLGAGMVSANIARHLATHLAGKDRNYRPLIYCWRGGQRSASLATVLAAVGWRVTVLSGGYKTYRAHVRAQLDALPPLFDYRLIGGATGSGKTRLLHGLGERGGQILDLEGLANHRGSALGNVGPQPSQKLFESLLLEALHRLDPNRPVWVEAESNRIGVLYVPPALWAGMKVATGVVVTMPVAGRVEHLLGEYRHWVADPAHLIGLLRPFAAWHGARVVAEWEDQIAAGAWPAFVASLLATHYDPRYAASAGRCFPNVTEVVDLADPSAAAFGTLAGELLQRVDRGPAHPEKF